MSLKIILYIFHIKRKCKIKLSENQYLYGNTHTYTQSHRPHEESITRSEGSVLTWTISPFMFTTLRDRRTMLYQQIYDIFTLQCHLNCHPLATEPVVKRRFFFHVQYLVSNEEKKIGLLYIYIFEENASQSIVIGIKYIIIIH